MKPHRPCGRWAALGRAALLTAFSTVFLVGCTTPKTAQHYEPEQARMLQAVAFGVITDVRAVIINGASSGQGATAGAVMGALPGTQSGNNTSAVLGGVLGSFLGQGLETATARRGGVELLVALDDGSSVAVTQQADGLVYAPGQRVRVIMLNGSARVVHHNGPASPRAAPKPPADSALPEGVM